MALFDTNSGLGGLLGNLGDYGFGLPSNTGGLVADAEREAINKRALLSGLISAGLTYAATPKNLGAGNILPYLGRAGLAGFGASQDVVDRSLNTAYRNKILTGKDDNIRTIKQDRFEITQEKQPDGSYKEIARSAIDAPRQPQETKYTIQTDASGQAIYVPDRPGLPVIPAPYKPALSPDQAKRQEKLEKAKEIPDLLKEAELLLPKATGSGLGAVRDIAAATVGQSTEGAKNLAGLKYIQSQLILKMPRLEGPQGVLDLKLYESAAADIGNPYVPADTKKAALDTIKRLSTKYDINETPSQPTQQSNVQAPTSGFKEGAKTKSKSGKSMIFRNGQWEYE
jgi:hypothetical protein